MIKANLTEPEALQIARDYCKRYVPGLNLDNIIKSMFYEKNYRIDCKEAAWVFYVKIDLGDFEGTDVVKVVISDKDKKFKFIIDHNGIPQTDSY